MPFPTQMHEIRRQIENRLERAEHQQKFKNSVTNQRAKQKKQKIFAPTIPITRQSIDQGLQGWG
jgi:hypothetical protein